MKILGELWSKLKSVAVKRLVALALAAAIGAVLQECGAPQAVIDATVNAIQIEATNDGQ